MLIELTGKDIDATIDTEEIQSVSYKKPSYSDFDTGYIEINLKQGNSVKVKYKEKAFHSCSYEKDSTNLKKAFKGKET